MTEQIERELAELFHDRAERLDVLPPLPAARVRRARLHAALAMASVVAVLAAAGVVGLRLSSGPAGGGVSFDASSGTPQQELDNVEHLMAAGRWRATARIEVGAGSTPTAGSPPEFVLQADWDGTNKEGIVRQRGKLFAIQVGGVTYRSLQVAPALARYLPPGARWQRTDEANAGLDPVWTVVSVPGSTPKSMTVHRTKAGLAIDSQGTLDRSHTDVTLRADGTISAVHTVSRVHMADPRFSGSTTTVVDAVYTRLATSLHVSVPDPATVITERQYAAAFEKYAESGSSSGQSCSPAFAPPSPAVSRRSPGSAGSAATTQSTTVFSCRTETSGTLTATLMPTPGPH